jgi:hypothetical protein
MKIEINNLTALIQGRDLNLYQRSLAVEEWHKLLNHVKEMEQALSIADIVAMLPSPETIEANGIEGGLRDGELQMFWEGAEWLKNHLRKRLLSKVSGA